MKKKSVLLPLLVIIIIIAFILIYLPSVSKNAENEKDETKLNIETEKIIKEKGEEIKINDLENFLNEFKPIEK